jgi:hypothetical protein
MNQYLKVAAVTVAVMFVANQLTRFAATRQLIRGSSVAAVAA